MATRKNFPRNQKLRRQGALERLQKRINVLSHANQNDGKLEWSIAAAANLVKKIGS